jgi:hypothetical protein
MMNCHEKAQKTQKNFYCQLPFIYRNIEAAFALFVPFGGQSFVCGF